MFLERHYGITLGYDCTWKSRSHFKNYGTVGIGESMGIRVLSRRSISRSRSFLLPLCNEDTGPVTPCSDISGCDKFLHNNCREINDETIQRV
ncbi:hypothetical protein HanLR1_Chr11g0394891 [Helianthus annuus]|nr:hypothetical protein HanHA89_Chr11g0417501 [Helianthus annuus]KAJ0684772.1 hypothetical protein HanLR1_Chr11g0394891 [Helianthus annuus]